MGGIEFEDPTPGFRSETPDAATFYAFDFGTYLDPPPLGSAWNDESLPGFAQSSLSQQDANQQAINASLTNTNNQIIPAGATGPAPLFGNDQQGSTVVCPGGVPFTWIMPAGEVLAYSKAIANAEAASIAANSAVTEAICLSNLSATACGLGNFFLGAVTFTAPPTQPVTFTISSGQLPPGMVLTTLPNNGGCTISGVATGAGIFSFTLQASNLDGTFMARTYTISVLAIVNLSGMPGAEIGVPYNYQISAAYGTAPYSFAIVGGSLPTGLSMTSAGLISGTPTHTGGPFSVSIQCTDSVGTATTASNAPTSLNCDAGTAWTINPGNCRLKIPGYTPTFFPVCGSCPLGGSKDWDGTFPTFSIGVNPTYACDASVNRINTMSLLGGYPQLFWQAGPQQWRLQVVCLGFTIWDGSLVSPNPVGTYAALVDCSGVMPTIQVQAYTT